MKFRLLVLCLLISPLALASSGPAPLELEQAEVAYRELDYERCRAAATAALELPGARSERMKAYRLLGLCTAALGHLDAARGAFMRLLALDPTARLPAGISPRFASTFLEAKGQLVGQPPLELQLLQQEAVGGVRVLRVAVADPLDQVAQVAHRRPGEGLSPGRKAAARMELEIPAAGVVEVVALDAHGGELAQLRIEAPGTAADPVAATAPTAPPETGAAAEAGAWPWILAGVGGGVVVGVAAAVGLTLAAPARLTPTSEVVFGDAP